MYLWSCGSPQQKLEWAFQMYDIDGNGKLDTTEVRHILKVSNTIYFITFADIQVFNLSLQA